MFFSDLKMSLEADFGYNQASCFHGLNLFLKETKLLILRTY